MPIDVLKHAMAGFPAIAIATADEDRTIASLVSTLMSAEDSNVVKTTILVMSAAGGLKDMMTGKTIQIAPAPATVQLGMPMPPPSAASYPTAFTHVAQIENALLIVLDLQHLIAQSGIYRALRNALKGCKSKGSMIVMIAPHWKLPPEIVKEIPVLSDPMPTREELSGALDLCLRGVGCNSLPDKERAALLNSASGLTMAQAENAFALSYEAGRFDPQLVIEEKMKMIRQSGYFDIIQPSDPAELGGLDALRQYVTDEVLPNADDQNLRVRGILLVGVPGTGKTLAARTIASMLGWPILSCNIGKLKAGKVGDSQANIAGALKLAEAFSPCVLLFDELEKGTAGHASSGETDGGTTSDMIGQLCTWLNDHGYPILTIGTVNDYSKLPAELTRAGRFDERFFVDIPNRSDRVDIAKVHLKRWVKKAKDLEKFAEVIAEKALGWVGGEIAQLVLSTARRTRMQLTEAALVDAAQYIKPMSLVRAAEIAALRQWGNDNLRAANSPEVEPAKLRRISSKAAR
jgi:hypothetical protein